MNLPKFESIEWFKLVDKSTWAKGEWDNESDRIQWLHEASGYPCLIRRGYVSGAWTGYVGISESNRAYELDENSVDDLLEEGVCIEVHGGLTFADFGYQTKLKYDGIYIEGDEDSEKLWWFGFDCAHAWDISPALNAFLQELGHEHVYFSEEVYRTQEYAITETNSLAEQLAKFEKEIES